MFGLASQVSGSIPDLFNSHKNFFGKSTTTTTTKVQEETYICFTLLKMLLLKDASKRSFPFSLIIITKTMET